jgi:hypothetical protein
MRGDSMGTDNKKGVLYIFIVIVMLLSLINIAQFSSAQGLPPDPEGPGGSNMHCCVLDSACSNDLDEQSCSQSNGNYIAEDCSLVDACTGVCCKLNDITCEFKIKGACQNIGYIIPGVSEAQCEPSYCVQGDVALMGTVKYSDDTIAAGARIDIINSTGNSRRIVAGEDGSFSIIVRKNQQYTINVYHKTNSNCNITNQLVDVQNNLLDMGDIQLPCTNTVSQCRTVWNIGPWSVPERECGVRTVTDTGNCNVASLDKPLQYKDCGQSTCGDGTISTGEECEPGKALPRNSDQCSDFEEGSEGTVSCSADCKIIKQCSSCEGACTDDSMCGRCPTCEGAPLCSVQCTSSDVVESFTATPSSRNGVKGITLDWTLPERCTQSNVIIYRCDGNNADNPTACNMSLNKQPRGLQQIDASGGSGYIDESFDSTKVKSYCYNISFTGTDGTSAFTLSYPRLVCASILDDECVGRPNEAFCEGTNLVSCTDGKSDVTSCSCGCRAETATLPAECVDESLCDVCDLCSGPFGLFAYNDYDISEISPYSGVYSNCRETVIAEGGNGYCYADDFSKNKAVIGQYHACHDVASCYDYRTNASCNSNPCDISAANDCKWVPLTTNDELGLGVCVPQNPEEQDCTKCNDLNILGDYCPRNLCYKFGEDADGLTTCYYNNVTKSAYSGLKIDNDTCMNIKDVACETYDLKEECLGQDEAGNYGNYNLLAQYDSEGKRLSGDHSYISLTQDIFNRGKCAWIEDVNPAKSRCVKDSDMSLIFDPESIDCTRKVGNEGCFLDFNNPETELLIGDKVFEDSDGLYSKAELLLLSVNVSEKVENTYISTLSAAGDVYPNLIYSSVAGKFSDKNIFRQNILSSEPADYALSFYSEDTSHNLEMVKTYSFSLLPDLSGIEVTFENSSAFYSNANKYLSSLTVSVNYDTELECEVSLKNNANTGAAIVGDARRMTPDLVWNYESLPDGIYTLSVICADSHMQRYNNTYILTFDADMSINAVHPNGQTYRAGQATFGLRTNTSAECYYTTNPNAIMPEGTLPGASQIGEWTRYSSTGGTTHETSVTEEESGMKYYYSACYFAYTQKWFLWNNGDVVYYAVDEIAPDILVYDYPSGELYNNSEMKEELSLKIVCSDNDMFFNTSKNYAFGCNDTIDVTRYYESYEDATVPSTEGIDFPFDEVGLPDISGLSFNDGDTMRIANGDFIDVPVPNSYVKVMLDITARDNGGNSKTITVFANVRNLSFMNPIVTICDPELNTCT